MLAPLYAAPRPAWLDCDDLRRDLILSECDTARDYVRTACPVILVYPGFESKESKPW